MLEENLLRRHEWLRVSRGYYFSGFLFLIVDEGTVSTLQQTELDRDMKQPTTRGRHTSHIIVAFSCDEKGDVVRKICCQKEVGVCGVVFLFVVIHKQQTNKQTNKN